MFYATIHKRDRYIKIIKFLEKWYFLRRIKESSDHFCFGPLGRNVFENIRNEWIRSNIVNRDKQVFLVDTSESRYPGLSIKEPFIAARKLYPDLPFGFANIQRIGNKVKVLNDNGSVIIKPKQTTTYRYIGILDPLEGRQFFYRWQLERKRWWRLFSRDPGNFSLNAETSDDTESATVVCKYSWGEFFLETINFHSSSWFDKLQPSEQNDFSIVIGKKRMFPHVIECSMSGELGTLLYLCDAFSDQDKKPIMIFHRKICPYKFAFSLPLESEDQKNDLLDLCKMLCLELRRRGVSTLWPQEAKKTLETQFEQHDSIGVPYTIVITLESLTSGIVGIRDRDTTLQEEIHINDIGEYGELLIKNYEINNF